MSLRQYALRTTGIVLLTSVGFLGIGCGDTYVNNSYNTNTSSSQCEPSTRVVEKEKVIEKIIISTPPCTPPPPCINYSKGFTPTPKYHCTNKGPERPLKYPQKERCLPYGKRYIDP
jgi:hypothetical protein